jgi:hypothetical protein
MLTTVAGATAGTPSCVAEQVTRPVRNREASSGSLSNTHDETQTNSQGDRVRSPGFPFAAQTGDPAGSM